MSSSYISLSFAALLPVIVSALFCIFEKYTPFGKIKYMWRQIIIGVIFGGLAIVGTEWGIPISGAMVNARDAAPLCAGLFFGGPAGIIAGVIGGVERWIAVAWGVGTFTRVACSVSTIIAGLYAAALRKYLFDNKRPGWIFSLAIGVVMEVFHLTMVYVTNLAEAVKAAQVVKTCTIPMILANSLSVMVAAIVLTIICRERLVVKKANRSISQTIQKGLLAVVLIAYFITTGFTYLVQTNLAKNKTQETLTTALNDIEGLIKSSDDVNDIRSYIDVYTKTAHIGQTGFMLATDDDLNVISGPASLQGENLIALGMASEQDTFEEGKEYDIKNDSDRYLAMYKDAKGYALFAVIPYDEAMTDRDNSLFLNSFMEVLVFAVLFAVIYLLIKKVVLNNLDKVNTALAKITAGDLDTVVDVKTNQEFASLSSDINSTVDTLKHYIDEAASRIDKELEFARNIQISALPHLSNDFKKAKLDEFSVAGCMYTAKEVGGDFYDIYMTDENVLNFVIADVSGKGIPAAMFMMRALTQLKNLRESGQSIDQVFINGNNNLCEGNDAGMFVTAWMGIMDTKTGTIQFANAGHNPPVIKHGNDSFKYLSSKPGFVLAGVEDVIYTEQTLKLDTNDILFLYTDGVTEATNANNELFGEDRLLAALNEADMEDMDKLCEHVKEKVAEFVGDAPQFDDITMVAIKYNR